MKSRMESLALRAKQPSTGGHMLVCSSKNSSLRGLPLLCPPRKMRARGVGPSVYGNVVEEEYDQILWLGP